MKHIGHLLGLLLSQLSLLLDLLLFVDGDVRVSLSVGIPLPGCLLLTAHLVVRTPGFIQLRTKTKTHPIICSYQEGVDVT